MVREKISISLLSFVLGVSRGGFYAWRSRPKSEREQANELLLLEMKKIHSDSRGTYGVPRIQQQLRHDGKSVGKMRVAKLMKKAGISGLIRKKFTVKTTDSKHDLPIAPRIFKTEELATHPTEPNKVWASDISYVPTDEGFLFLAMYLDLFTRKIVGFSTEGHMRNAVVNASARYGARTTKIEGGIFDRTL